MKTIELSQGFQTFVDDEDYVELSGHLWQVQHYRDIHYAARNIYVAPGKRRLLLMHRAILMPAVGFLVDHRDGNGLNNQRDNLRLATRQQNAANSSHPLGSSRFKGVSWNQRSQKWVSQLVKDSKNIYLGHFDLEKDAARAYDAKATEVFGEFAKLNFPQEIDQVLV